jgi:hypothetical protein
MNPSTVQGYRTFPLLYNVCLILLPQFQVPKSKQTTNTPPDRLPTVSAAQALSDLQTSAKRCISTGIRDLDLILQNKYAASLALDGDGQRQEQVGVGSWDGGVSRGRVTEVYGPSGVGKTALG